MLSRSISGRMQATDELHDVDRQAYRRAYISLKCVDPIVDHASASQMHLLVVVYRIARACGQ